MNLKEYLEMVKYVAKKDFKNKNEELLCWTLGLTGEAGDAVGCLKKTLFHNNNQMKGFREQLGDTFWYIIAICNCLGWDIEDIMQENTDKLRKRYPKGYTYEDASRNNTRIDWMEKDKEMNIYEYFTCEGCGKKTDYRDMYSNSPNLCKECFKKRNKK